MRFNHFTIPIVLLILSLVAPALAQRRDRDPGVASVSGRVTIEGKPAPGVVVTATRADAVEEAGNFGDTTDADGDEVVRGQVKFQNGEPPANACFYVRTIRRGACLNCFRDFQARVSAGGQYTLEGLPPGEYELTLQVYSRGEGGTPRIDPVKQAISVANGVEARADFVVDLNKKDQ